LPENYNVSDWAESELYKAIELDLIPLSLLEEDTDFTRPISRAEFAGIVVKTYESLANTQVLPATVNPFVDTSEIDVLKAFNAGIMVGYSETEFQPNIRLNREQAATALTRVFKRATIPGWSFATDANFPLTFNRSTPFAYDAHISSWAKESVYFMSANGIVVGIGNNMFAPRAMTSTDKAAGYAIATREQAITIAVRMINNLM